jgi:predicted TIM-barrel fold metal-dependent hydrolase
MENEYTFNFEFWDHKLYGILGMLNALSDHYMPPVEFELIQENLEATNFEDNIWTDVNISGKNHDFDLLLAKNQHEERGSIVIMITTQEDLTTAIKTLSMFQGLFKDLELE